MHVKADITEVHIGRFISPEAIVGSVMDDTEVLNCGRVIETHDTCIVVDVKGVEVYVGSKRGERGFEVTYNERRDIRGQKHGEEDPLDLE